MADTSVAAADPPGTEPQTHRGVKRIWDLWRRFRNEAEDPESFYSIVAAETVAQLEQRHGPVAGTRILDLGSGPGFYTTALRHRGAIVIPLDGSIDEVELAGPPPDGVVLADAGRTPFPNASFDAVFCSNLLEHARDTAAIVRELARLTRVGGWGYLSWTNWYSPHGGHHMTPYQYLGPEWGPRLWEKRHGLPHKNRFGEALFAVHVGPTLRLVRTQPGLRIQRAEPRYWPWASFIMRLPGIREVLSWNCVIHVQRKQVNNGG